MDDVERRKILSSDLSAVQPVTSHRIGFPIIIR
jgi:hypothetical protein